MENKNFSEIIKFIRELVKIPSQIGIDSEKEIAKFIFEKLKNCYKKGIPVLNGFGCDCGNLHAPNEWVDLRDLPRVFKIYENH